ncbi:response regulator transcription factor [Staphylococcus equorum]
MHQIILVDDHHIVRQGLEFLLSTVNDIDVIGGFSDGKSFFEYLETNELPDIVLLDLVMPEMNGIEITEIMKKSYPEVKILVLTSYVDDEHVISAIDKGADGYEMKDVEPDQLIKTIKKVLSGEKTIHPQAQSVIEAVSKKPHFTNKLSKRESEVLAEMTKGKTNKEIAESLFVSEKTIKTHVSHIFNKLQVTDRTQAAIYAMQKQTHLI